MKKLSALAIIFITTVSVTIAQPGELLIKNSDKGLYLDHKVAAKENFYSVGRLYNVPAKEIAAYNKLDMNKGLNLGQMIRIPLTSANFSQSGNDGTPVYYKVGEKEGLMKVSNANNKVTLESLRNWNHLNGDNVNVGSKLIIGFLVSGEMTSVATTEKKEPETNIAKVDKPVEKPIEIKPIETKPVETKSEPRIEEKKPEEKPKVSEPVVIEKPRFETRSSNSDQGYFKSFFDQQVRSRPTSKSETLTSGIFKTTSGWVDSKYYLLIDGVQPGTIIKVVNPENNKSVYAKVLGEMSGIRQNEGLNIRISNAAASVLQVTEQDKFIVKVNY